MCCSDSMPSELVPTRRPLPFYGTWALFSRALSAFKEHDIPERLTTRTLYPLLGDEASRIVSGFSAMGWIDDRDMATAPLRQLVSAFGESSWQATLKDIVPKTYSFVPGNWANLTPEELHSAFLAHSGREVSVISSAETFFLVLAHQAGFALTEKLYRRAVRAISDAKIKGRASTDASDGGGVHNVSSVESGGSVVAIEPAAPKQPAKPSLKSRRDDSQTDAEWVTVIVKLSTLLGGSGVTDQERNAIVSTISVVGRQIRSA